MSIIVTKFEWNQHNVFYFLLALRPSGQAERDIGAKKSTAIRSPLDILSLRIEETEIQYFNLELPIMNMFQFFAAPVSLALVDILSLMCFRFSLYSVLCASVCLPFVLIIRCLLMLAVDTHTHARTQREIECTICIVCQWPMNCERSDGNGGGIGCLRRRRARITKKKQSLCLSACVSTATLNNNNKCETWHQWCEEQRKKLSYPILQSMSQASFVY